MAGEIPHAYLFFLPFPCFIPVRPSPSHRSLLPPIIPLTLQDLQGDGGGGIPHACMFFFPLPCFIPVHPPPKYPLTFIPLSLPHTLTL